MSCIGLRILHKDTNVLCQGGWGISSGAACRESPAVADVPLSCQVDCLEVSFNVLPTPGFFQTLGNSSKNNEVVYFPSPSVSAHCTARGWRPRVSSRGGLGGCSAQLRGLNAILEET